MQGRRRGEILPDRLRGNFPGPGLRCVTTIVTDLAVIDVTPSGLALREVAPQWTADEVQQLTGAKLNFTGAPPEMRLK